METPDVLEIAPRRVDAQASPTPEFVAPAEGAAVDAAYAAFEWTDIPGADAYRFEVAEDAAFTQLVVDAAVGQATVLTLFEAFPPDGCDRFARVEALEDGTSLSVSTPVRFRPVTDVELEREQLAASEMRARRKPARPDAPAGPVEVRGGEEAVVEPWRTATTSEGQVIGIVAIMILMVAAFGIILFV